MPEARAYYDSIFRMYAEWGVDFVKCDDIAREYPHCKREIEVISDACRACGRDIVLSLSPGPAPLEQAEHLKKYANMWRITDDFWDEWRLLKGMFERAENGASMPRRGIGRMRICCPSAHCGSATTRTAGRTSHRRSSGR